MAKMYDTYAKPSRLRATQVTRRQSRKKNEDSSVIAFNEPTSPGWPAFARALQKSRFPRTHPNRIANICESDGEQISMFVHFCKALAFAGHDNERDEKPRPLRSPGARPTIDDAAFHNSFVIQPSPLYSSRAATS